jgi:predicted metal-dependent hydrolase
MPEEIIKLAGYEVKYFLRISSRAKRLRLTVYSGPRLVVTKPKDLAKKSAEQFLKQKTKWILAKLNHFKQKKPNFLPILSKAHKASYRKHKLAAQKLAQERAKYFCRLLGVCFNKIVIKNQKSRWASCSKKGNLNFSYRLALLPQELADYIVAHEVCHLKEFNHSAGFWQLVVQLSPNYQSLRKRLRFI